MGEIFQITVSSNYAELWRYNIAVVAACFDKDHNQIEVVAERSHLADVGANLRMAESGWMERHKLLLKTPACESIESLVYLIPHTLPAVREIEDASPFQIKIGRNFMRKPTWLTPPSSWTPITTTRENNIWNRSASPKISSGI